MRTINEILDDRTVSGLQWQVVGLCGLVAIFEGFDIQSISYAAPAIGREWGIPKEAFGFIFSVGIGGMLLGLLLQALIADKLGRKPLILVSVALFGVVTIAAGLASTMTELVMSRLIAGLGMGAALPNVIALTSEYAPARLRVRLIVLMNIGIPVGGLLGGLISAPLIEMLGWRSIFLVGGFGPLLLLPLLLIALPESLPFLAASRRRGALARFHSLLGRLGIDPAQVATSVAPVRGGLSLVQLFREGRARNTIFICLTFFINLLTFYVLMAWLPMLMTQSGLPLGKAVLVSAGLNLGSIVGGFVLGWFADKSGARLTLFGTYLCTMMLFLLMGGGFSWSFGAIALLAALLGLCLGGAQLVLNAAAAEFYPLEMRASGVGTAAMVGRVGAIAGPIIGGLLLANGVAAETLYLLLAAPAMLAGVSAFAMQKGNVPVPQEDVSVTTGVPA